MKYISRFHIAVKPRLKTAKWLWVGVWLCWWKKVEVLFVCKGDKEVIGKALTGRDIMVKGKVGKIQYVELIYPWDKFFFGVVNYRGSLVKTNADRGIRKVNGEEIRKYG